MIRLYIDRLYDEDTIIKPQVAAFILDLEPETLQVYASKKMGPEPIRSAKQYNRVMGYKLADVLSYRERHIK